MAEDIKKEPEVKTEVDKKPEPKVDIKDIPKKVDYSQFVDKEAMAEIQKQNADLEAKVEKLSGVTQKLSDVKSAITGEENKEVKSEKFFKEFAEDPEGSLNKFYEGKLKAELDPIKAGLRERELADQDMTAFRELQKDADYQEVMKNVNTYIKPEELAELLKQKNRTELIYGLTKTRMGIKGAAKKMEESQATKQAKDNANQTAVSETPSGKSNEYEDDAQRRRKSIDDRIAKGDWKDKSIYDDAFDDFWDTAYGAKK